jgi:transcription-repair coupling factor (superfamily II helicase)
MWVPFLLALVLGLRTTAYRYQGNLPPRGDRCLALLATPAKTVRQVSRVPLLTDVHMARIMVAGDRYVVPGDYVVNELYGVGKYLGIRQVNISPAQEKQTFVPSVVVQYLDGEVTWFEKFVQRELWVFRTAESGEQELGSVLDLRKWNRKKKSVEVKSRR